MNKKIVLIIIASIILIGVIAMIPIYHFNQGYARELIAAIEDGDIVKVEKIAKQKGNINARPCIWRFFDDTTLDAPPLFNACRSGNIKMVKILVENGADINVFWDNNNYPLSVALSNFQSSERQEIARYLLDNGLDIKQIENKYKDFWSIVFCPGLGLAGGNFSANETVEYKIFLDFIAQGLQPEEDTVFSGGNLLHNASFFGNTLIAKYLIEELYYNIDTKDYKGQTALITAVIKNYQDILEYLLSKGADKTIKDNDGKTALDYAIESGKDDFAALLS
jgi:ankyrin repeat protein